MSRLPSTHLAWLLASLTITACAEPSDLSDGDIADLYEDAFEQDRDGKADNATCSGVVVPDRAPFAKVVALTFDDGPNPATTPIVLETLRRHGVPATFFINGQRVNSDEAERIAADIAADPAFELGNHTWSHPNMTTLGSAAVADQIDDTTSVIQTAGATPRFFRFPFGASTCRTAEAARSRGYAITGWHIDSADWCFSTGQVGVCPRSSFRYVDDDMRSNMAGYTLRQIRARGGGIVLFHDIHRYTAEQLDGIIQTLKDEGYSFTNLSDTDVFPLLNGVPAPPPTGDRARTRTALNLRAGPGTDYAVLATMPAGALVGLLGQADGDWLLVDYQGTSGWAHGDYLEQP